MLPSTSVDLCFQPTRSRAPGGLAHVRGQSRVIVNVCKDLIHWGLDKAGAFVSKGQHSCLLRTMRRHAVVV